MVTPLVEVRPFRAGGPPDALDVGLEFQQWAQVLDTLHRHRKAGVRGREQDQLAPAKLSDYRQRCQKITDVPRMTINLIHVGSVWADFKRTIPGES